jgi:hypothetical protein
MCLSIHAFGGTSCAYDSYVVQNIRKSIYVFALTGWFGWITHNPSTAALNLFQMTK